MQPSIVGEVLTMRQRHSKTYLMDSGEYMTVISSVPRHYQDAAGNWHNLDLALVDEADFDAEEQDGRPVASHIRDAFAARAAEVRAARAAGRAVNRDQTAWQVLRAEHAVNLPKNIKRGYSIGHGTDKLWFIPVGASPSRGQVSPNDAATVEYQDVWAQVDVRLTVTPSGVKEVLVLKTLGAARTFTWEADGALADDLTCGSLQVHQGTLRDAAGTVRAVPVVKRSAQGKTYVDVAPDVTGLVAPVEVDPTTTITSIVASAQIDSGNPTMTGPSPSTINVDVQQSAGTRKYGLLQLSLAGITGVGTISSATLNLQVTTAQYFSAQLNVDRITSAWSATTVTYDTRPSRFDTGLAYSPAVGTANLAVTSIVQDWLINGQPNYGFWFEIPGTQANTYSVTAFDGQIGTTPPTLTITYTQVPSAPTVTAPNGGETWNAQHTITWTAATDPDTTQGSLRYQIQLSTDNRATWSDIIALTAAGATSYPYDFSAKPESATCFVRIRAYDGTSYGPWDESNAAFTIAHNQAPQMPSNLSPAGGVGVDRAAVARLSWQHNDPNGDPQSKFDLMWSPDGGVTWNTVTQATPNQYWDAPAATFPHGNIVWKARTYDQADLAGPYAAQVLFVAGDKPTAPVILYPAPGASIGTASPTIDWSSSGQVGYQVQAIGDGNAILWDSGDTAGGLKTATVGNPIANGANVTLQVRIRNTDAVWSDWATVPISISYTPPGAGVMSARAILGTGHILAVVKGQGPDVAANDLYRRVNGGDWVLRAAGLPVNAEYEDYAVASGVPYEYMVRVRGTNTVVTDSAVACAIVTFEGWRFTPVDDPAGQIPFLCDWSARRQLDEDRRSIKTMGRYPITFRGPSRPVRLDLAAVFQDDAGMTPGEWAEAIYALSGTIGYLRSPDGDIWRGELYGPSDDWTRNLVDNPRAVRVQFEEKGLVP